MQTRTALAALVAALLSLSLGGPGAAATVEQVRTFDYQQSLMTALDPYDVTATKSLSLHFDSFDAGLGTLTGVTWSLTSTRFYDIALSMVGTGVNFLQSNDLSTDVRFGGVTLGSGGPLGPAGPISCLTGDAGFCIRSAKDDDTFAFTTAFGDRSLFFGVGGVDAEIRSKLFLLGDVIGDFTSSAAASSIDWDGELKLTYSYSTGVVGPGPTPAPAPVPEPAAWGLAIIGFGLSASALRRRTRMQRAA